jgi:hypothetical protein
MRSSRGVDVDLLYGIRRLSSEHCAAEGLDRMWGIEGGAKCLVMRNAANGNPRKISLTNLFTTNAPKVTTLRSFLMLKSDAVSAK